MTWTMKETWRSWASNARRAGARLGTTTVMPEEGERFFASQPFRSKAPSRTARLGGASGSEPRKIQITAPISHGNSGSPVFNMKGQVIGVVTIRVMNGQNINLAMGSPRFAVLRHEGARPFGFDELAARSRGSMRSEAVSEWSYRNGLNSLWLGNYESALGYFETAVNKNPNRVEAWIQVGFEVSRQEAGAIRAFQQALKLRPSTTRRTTARRRHSTPGATTGRGVLQALALRPDLAEGYYNLGLAISNAGTPRRLRPGRKLKDSRRNAKKLVNEIER